uniref:Uncharacterized protein n=1 Tax=Meloidogyne floridensis TaxID=298350 RepID=A0A915PAM3_9BILA
MLFARRRATNTSFYLNNEELVNFDNINDNNNNLEYTSSKEQQIDVIKDKSELDDEGKEENKKSKKEGGGEEFKEKTVLVEQHSLLTTSSETSKTNTTTTGKQAIFGDFEFTSASHSITNDSTTNSTNKMVGRSHSTGPETGSQIINKQQQQQIATGGTTR